MECGFAVATSQIPRNLGTNIQFPITPTKSAKWVVCYTAGQQVVGEEENHTQIHPWTALLRDVMKRNWSIRPLPQINSINFDGTKRMGKPMLRAFRQSEIQARRTDRDEDVSRDVTRVLDSVVHVAPDD